MLRKQSCHDVEPVFAQIKHNKAFKRLFLIGQNKVEIETGLIAIVHNLKKLALQGEKPSFALFYHNNLKNMI